MPDMLVKLYELPALEPEISRLIVDNIVIRRARSYEKSLVIAWVRQKFSVEWADECDVAFGLQPISCFIATESGQIIGFACYHCTAKDYFGPTGVDESKRGHGIGRVLLLACLHALLADGYAYAIIGGVGPAEFYSRTVGATIIDGSVPGIYVDRLKK
jgi:GNAT superfamily N-acetyltransferase